MTSVRSWKSTIDVVSTAVALRSLRADSVNGGH